MVTSRIRMTRAVTAAALLVALLVAPAVSGGPVTITFWHGMSGVLLPAVDELTRDFNKLNPGIVVNAQYQGNYGVLNQKLIAAVAAGNPPTVSQVFPTWTDQLMRAGAIVPVSRFFRGPDGLTEDDLNDIFPILRQSNTFGGTMWTMPFNKSLYLLFYNADLLKELNLKVPQTWDEFVTTARALTKEEGGRVVRYGFVVRPNVDSFTTMLLANGGTFLRSEREVAFNGPAGVEALQWLGDLVQKHRAAYVLPGFADADFGAGKVAMYIATNPGLSFAKAAVGGKFQVGLAPLPYRRTKATILSGTDVAILARATPEQQAAAWKYIKFLTSTNGTTRWSLRTYYMPVRRSGRDSTLMRVYLRDNPEHRAGLESLEFARTEPSMAEWQEIRDIISDAVEQAVLGKVPPQQALDAAAQKANRLLQQRK
jgi:multiple sugar transport system substrate-binding protein